jgi:hypothetical protein
MAETLAESVRRRVVKKIDELICNENGDRLEKRVRTNAGLDVEEFLRDFEDPDSPAGQLLDSLIGKDDAHVTAFLRAVTNDDRHTMRSAAEKIFQKS